VLAHPSRPVAIVGTQQLGRVADAVAASAVRLTRSEVYEIIEASEGVPLP
jgi:predicted oxidoreductase